MNIMTDRAHTVTSPIVPPATPAWAERTEVYEPADEWAWDPSAYVGEHVTPIHEDDNIEVAVKSTFRRDGSAHPARPFVFVEGDCEELTSEQARALGVALIYAADALDSVGAGE